METFEEKIPLFSWYELVHSWFPREGSMLSKYILFSPCLRMEKLKGSSGDTTSTVMKKNNLKLVFLTLIPSLLCCTASLKCGLLSSSQVTSRLEWWIKKAS